MRECVRRDCTRKIDNLQQALERSHIREENSWLEGLAIRRRGWIAVFFCGVCLGMILGGFVKVRLRPPAGANLPELQDVEITNPQKYDVLVETEDGWINVPGPCAAIPTPEGCEP